MVARDPNFSNKVACGIIDILVQLVILPVCMFTGFYRLVTFNRSKSSYHITAAAQEILLHQLPVSVIMLYNNEQL